MFGYTDISDRKSVIVPQHEWGHFSNHAIQFISMITLSKLRKDTSMKLDMSLFNFIKFYKLVEMKKKNL